MTTTATPQVRIPAFRTQCRSRCGCTAVLDGGRLSAIEPLPEHPTGAKLCPKGRAAPELVYHPERLTEPLRRVPASSPASPAAASAPSTVGGSRGRPIARMAQAIRWRPISMVWSTPHAKTR